MIQAGSLTVRETVRLLIRLWHHLRRRRKRQFIAVTSLMLLSAFAEVATLGAVIPFITVLVNPDRVMQYEVVASLARSIGVVQPEDLGASSTGRRVGDDAPRHRARCRSHRRGL